MKRIYLLLFLFSCINAAAQTSLGIKAGISAPVLEGYGENAVGYKSRNALHMGFLVDFKLTSLFSLQTELNYFPQGGERAGLQELPPYIVNNIVGLPNSTKLYANYKKTVVLNYLEIPILLKATFGNRLKYYLCMGPYFSFLINARTATKGSSLIYLDGAGNNPLTEDGNLYPLVSFNNTEDTRGNINDFDAGVEAGVGFAYPVGKGSIFLEGRLNVGFTNIQADPSSNGKNQTGATAISVGYIIGIK